MWRPLVNHAEDYPFALMKTSSLDPTGLIPVGHLGSTVPITDETKFPIPGFKLIIDYCTYNANQLWYWMSNQTPDEAVIFTQWDSHPPKGEADYNCTLPFSLFLSLSLPCSLCT